MKLQSIENSISITLAWALIINQKNILRDLTYFLFLRDLSF